MWKNTPKPVRLEELEGQCFGFDINYPPIQDPKNPNFYRVRALVGTPTTKDKTLVEIALIGKHIRQIMDLATDKSNPFRLFTAIKNDEGYFDIGVFNYEPKQ